MEPENVMFPGIHGGIPHGLLWGRTIIFSVKGNPMRMGPSHRHIFMPLISQAAMNDPFQHPKKLLILPGLPLPLTLK